MLVQIFMVAHIVQWFAACNSLETTNMCEKFVNSMNKSDTRVNCHRTADDWRFETSNIIVKITLRNVLNIHCRQPEAGMADELNFFNFSSYEYRALILNECPQIRDVNMKVDHLELSHIENFNLIQFTELQVLELDNASQIQNLNSLDRLQKLTIHRTYLSNFTIKLDRLVTLTLKLNYIADDLSGIQLMNLKNFYLRSNRNLRLANFENFPNLAKLEISSEYAANQSYNINRMKLNPNLEVLGVSYYECSEIWNELLFAGHQKLRTLRLNNNRIGRIQNNRIFNNLPNLEVLDLSGNALAGISFLEGSNLPRLRVLNLSSNKITQLGQSLYKLTALEQLYLNKNLIIHMDDEFLTTAHENLSAVYLQDNLLSFGRNSQNNPFKLIAPSLVTLNLKSNRITQFNEVFAFEFHNLTNLDLSRNAITEIRGSELKFSHPIRVNFESNDIRVIRFDAGTNYNEVTLKFSQNDRFERENCANYEFIKYFSFNRALVDFPDLENVTISNYYCIEENDNSMCAVDKCLCKKFPYTNNYYISCRNKNLTQLPNELPNFPDPTFTVNLDLDNNNFAGVSNFELPASYYTKITRLSLRNCTVNNFHAFQLHENRITELYLDDNHIPNFSYGVIKNFTNLENLTLANNRFECDCDTEYLYKFMTLKNYYNMDLLMCANYDRTDFLLNENYIVCPLINTTVLTTLIATLLLVIILSTITIVKLKFALELKLLIFVFKNRYFQSSVSMQNYYPYDLFLSYSDEDTDFVEKYILSKLESESRRPRNNVVTLNRDSTMDKMIPEQIVHFINNSKFIMIVLSTNFLNSDWNRFAFRAAYCNAFQNNRYPVIIVLKDKITDLNSIDPTLKSYLTTRTYIRYNSSFFWKRINYVLSK